MIELKEKIIHLDEYDIDVKQFLGYDEIQEIINLTLPLENWNERQKNIDMLILHYAAGIDIDVLQNADPDEYLCSGLINAVKCNVENWIEIYEGIDYHTSTAKLLYSISKQLPDIVNNPQFKEMMNSVNRNK